MRGRRILQSPVPLVVPGKWHVWCPKNGITGRVVILVIFWRCQIWQEGRRHNQNHNNLMAKVGTNSTVSLIRKSSFLGGRCTRRVTLVWSLLSTILKLGWKVYPEISPFNTSEPFCPNYWGRKKESSFKAKQTVTLYFTNPTICLDKLLSPRRWWSKWASEMGPIPFLSLWDFLFRSSVARPLLEWY